MLVSKRRDGDAARGFFGRVLTTLKVTPSEVVTDAAPVYPRVLDELVPAAWHHVERYENNRIEADHGRLKHRLRPMRGLRTDHTATVIITGLAVHAEPSPRTLRTRHRNSPSFAGRRGVHRACLGDLTRRPNRVHHARRRDYATAPLGPRPHMDAVPDARRHHPGCADNPGSPYIGRPFSDGHPPHVSPFRECVHHDERARASTCCYVRPSGGRNPNGRREHHIGRDNKRFDLAPNTLDVTHVHHPGRSLNLQQRMMRVSDGCRLHVVRIRVSGPRRGVLHSIDTGRSAR